MRKSVDMGYRYANLFRFEAALDPLRERVDFKKRREELEEKSPTKPRSPP